ncbi:MAG: PKD domain-containing protein [Bacteroidales bacterium]|nr:PKD domain-containing protein [Bacteroidales bacterium]
MNKLRYLILGLIILCLLSPVSATIVGIRWNASNSSPSAITYIDINGNPMDKPNFNMTLPWSGMRRINLSTTQYQTMVTVPKFWYNGTQYISGGNTYNEWWISDTNVTSLKVHPAFISNGVELPSFLMSAFEGSVYNVTTSSYNTGDFAGVNTSVGGDMLSSVAGSKPTSGQNNSITLPYFRNLSHNRGTGWELQNFNQISAIELLYLIEYANFNSQSVIGAGVTQITDDGSTNMAVNTGYTAGVGVNASQLYNTSGQAVITHYKTGQTTYPNSYRGVENVYGNIWKWGDGINIKTNRDPWVADHDFASDTFVHPYVDTGFTLAASNNYGVSIAFSSAIDYAFLPLTVGGSSSTYLCDYYSQTTGNRSALLGGDWSGGTSAGAFRWYLVSAAADAYRSFGARLSYIPNGTALTDANYTFTPANATFTQNATEGQDRVAVAFTDGSTGKAPLTYSWYFTDVSGNNTPILFSNSASPEQMFGWGNYSINLTLVNTYSFDSAYSWVNVSHLTSSFTTNVTSGVKPLTVMFNDTSYGGTTVNRLWEFGDGGTSITRNLTYTYDTGVYTVNLTVSNLYGSSTSQKTITVYSTSPPSLDANFNASTTIPAVGAPVTFYDLSTGSPTTWNWSFGDGVNSTAQNPSHAYSTTGLKTVFLTVQNATSSDTETKVNYINVSTLGGFTQQDIWMDPQYILALNVVDSATGLVIPDVSLTDSSTTYLTTNGTFILTYPYSTVVLTLASTGYAGKQVSYVMDSDRTETVQLTAQSTPKTTTWYSPHQVRLAVISNTGTLLTGTTVNATANSTTMPDDYLTSLYGIDPTIANDMLNGTLIMSGVTGSDGAIVYTMHGSISYDVSLTNPATGTLFKIFLMPIENNYDIRLGATTANATYSQINATMLTVSEPDASHFKLGVNYLDTSGLSNNMTFTVSCVDNGTVLYKQEYTAFGTSAILSNYTLANVWGEGYVWKYVAYRADGSVLSQGATVTGKGPNGVMVDLGLPSLNWYRWISVCILFMMGAMASQRTKQFWALLIPIFAALFLWFGWFTGTSSTAGIITLCVVLGAIVYMKSSLREKFGVGGPGTMLLNIVIYLLILQACVGFINGLNVWTDAGFGNQATAVVNQWSNIEIKDISDLQSTGGWGLTALATAEFFADMLLSAAIVFINILFSIVTIYPTVQLLFPWMLTSPQTIAFLALLQLGIWILYAKFMFDYFAKPSYGTDDF